MTQIKPKEPRCDKDYKKNHHWESIGIVDNQSKLHDIFVRNYQVWKCTQCKKIKYEELKEL